MISPDSFFALSFTLFMKFILALIRQLGSTLLFPVSWTITLLVLLCLPGNSIPGNGLFSIKHLDKVAHIGLFGGFVLFWGLYAWAKKKRKLTWPYALIGVTFISIILGIAMEYVQLNFIPDRSFDIGDIGADIIGSLLALIILGKFGARLGLLIE